MSFVYAFALALGVLTVAPYLAHRLRRRRAEEREFAAAHLVPPAPPRARSRSKLEDRALFAIRAAAVVGLAILGASPLVRCSRLSLSRSSGASVAMAVVLDDSMSMRATLGGTTRFERARSGALELLASTREGDAVAIVMAGRPARVALAATSDLAAARGVIETASASDRGTDLDGAMAMAHELLAEMPQIDRRIIVLSDLADGRAGAPPLGKGSDVPVWVPLPELRGAASDCGILRADRSGARVRIRIACSAATGSPGPLAKPRDVVVMDGERVVAHTTLNIAGTEDVNVVLSDEDARKTDLAPLVARLSPGDAIAADDVAAVIVEAGPGSVAVVADPDMDPLATGGAPVVEQALSALQLDVSARPLPTVPDRGEDLAPFLGVLVDDPPGWTPEERRSLTSFLDSGGFLLLALGPRSAAPPLGASLEPVVTRPVAWDVARVRGVDPRTAAVALAESAASALDLETKNRASVAAEDMPALDTMLRWSDGLPFVARRAIGHGEAWIVTLPFAVEVSDLPLRPLFLAILDSWITEAKSHSSPRRTEAGVAWTFSGARTVEVTGPSGPLALTREGSQPRVVPALLGQYKVTIDGKSEARVVMPVEAEIDLTPRPTDVTTEGKGLGDSHAKMDVSPEVAVALLGLMLLELLLRGVARRSETPT